MATLPNAQIIPDGAGIPDLRFQEPWQLESIKNINIIANSVSIASASTVLIILLAMRLYDHRLVDRVSLRLTAAISFTDLISATSLLIYTYSSDSGSACEIAAFLVIWLSNQYIFLTTAIAFNLQWLFLQSRYYNPVFEKWYYIISVLFSIITAIIPLMGHVLGYDTAQGACWFTPSYTPSTQLWEYGTYIVPQLLCLTYCTTVVLLVIIKLLRDANPKNIDHEENIPPSSSQTVVHHVVRRILLYPTTPLLTQLGFIVSEIYMFQTLTVSYELNIWGVLTKALPGFFNLLGFLMDPAFMGALRLLKRDLIRRYGDSSSDLHRSSSHRSFDKRSYKIYADHGALDFVMPRDTTCASLAPLAKDQPSQKKSSNNKCMKWIVNRFWKQSEYNNSCKNQGMIVIPSMPGSAYTTTATDLHTNSSSEKTAAGGGTTTSSSSSSDNLPTFLNSPTAYLIGEEAGGMTQYQRHDIIKDYPPITNVSPPYYGHSYLSSHQDQQQQQENNSNGGAFTIPVFMEDQLDEAVPWRVLEASLDEQQNQLPHEQQELHHSQQQQQRPGSYSNTTRHSSTEMDSWLELSEPVSPSRMSQWLTKRGDSFEMVRERVARSSKSIRRWCRHQQQLYQEDQHEKMQQEDHYPTITTTNTSLEMDRQQKTLSGSYMDHHNNNTLLQSVPESHLESIEQETTTISKRL
ncbi:hypothetical protein BDA99DRAFT_543324 [Phascolomyces articulosus]|uniref:G-protein coupled receptors family 2 profile 2 domain-containing protein n=1 Tax=Phascolomyces articulosus TaxID=60185 RepID=A0AAD5JY51_9FUNG|nr:hypothetical protein BDA99DRAFT_543324 [Phascolomyces articulosus]